MLFSKAGTLRFLAESRASTFVVDPFVVFTVEQWRKSPAKVLESVQGSGIGEMVVVRSSATIEDADPDLPPGLFHTELNVRVSDTDLLAAAVKRVVQSFSRYKPAQAAGDANEVIVQRQLVAAKMSGVINTGGADSFYFAVHYNDESDRTDCVTAGRMSKRADVLRDATNLPEPWGSLQQTVVEVKRLFGRPLLIEFAVSYDGCVHVFQARINRQYEKSSLGDRERASVIRLIDEAISQLKAHPRIWSDMADWNPAEMLGDRPRPLAISLYQYLVTDQAWMRGRVSLGYRSVTPSKLVDTLAGKPYVNVRRSFLSLIPASLSAELAERLVEDRLLALRQSPELHDKVELELLFTVADVAKPERTAPLLERGFSCADVEDLNTRLRALTNSVLTKYDSFEMKDTQLVRRLIKWAARNRPRTSRGQHRELLWFIQAGLGKCRDEGVVPFARQARLAFIARDLLSRLTVAKCITPQWLDAWWRGLETVAQKVTQAIIGLDEGRITRNAFDKFFGHLRARTYDICSPRYDRIDHLPSTCMPQSAGGELPPLEVPEKARFAEGLARAGIDTSVDEFLSVARRAMKAREETKFGFSSFLSDILEAIALFGETLGFSREDLSFLSVEDLIAAAREDTKAKEIQSQWTEIIKARQRSWTLGLNIVLPDLILDPMDLQLVPQRTSRPNFITKQTVAAEIVVLDSTSPTGCSALNGRIVAVEAADPGFDWIFASGIAGLITRFGGAASHMAIRCAEFGIPGAIGCGDELFRHVAQARRVVMDCAGSRIEVIE